MQTDLGAGSASAMVFYHYAYNAAHQVTSARRLSYNDAGLAHPPIFHDSSPQPA